MVINYGHDEAIHIVSWVLHVKRWNLTNNRNQSLSCWILFSCSPDHQDEGVSPLLRWCIVTRRQLSGCPRLREPNTPQPNTFFLLRIIYASGFSTFLSSLRLFLDPKRFHWETFFLCSAQSYSYRARCWTEFNGCSSPDHSARATQLKWELRYDFCWPKLPVIGEREEKKVQNFRIRGLKFVKPSMFGHLSAESGLSIWSSIECAVRRKKKRNSREDAPGTDSRQRGGLLLLAHRRHTDLPRQSDLLPRRDSVLDAAAR